MATQPAAGFDLNRPTIIGLLYLVGVITALPTIIALILAYIWRGEPHEPWEDSHYRYLIRTFWLALVYGVIGFMTTLLGIGFLILLLVPVWMIVRSIVSIGAAQRHQPVDNPGTWLW